MEAKNENQNNTPVILIAIDSPSVRKFVGMAIKMAGFQIIMAVDGIDAIEKVRDTMPQLVIADIDEKAKNLVEFLRSKYCAFQIPIIVLVQHECPGEKEMFPYADSILAKPFTFDKIVQTVKKNMKL